MLLSLQVKYISVPHQSVKFKQNQSKKYKVGQIPETFAITLALFVFFSLRLHSKPYNGAMHFSTGLFSRVGACIQGHAFYRRRYHSMFQMPY